MKLDKRIENERLIYTPFTTTKPKLHEKGYFTDDIHAFNSLEDCDCRYGELVEHDDDVDYAYPYCCKYDDGCGDGITTCDWFAFYIPESSLKQKEKQKQYRAFTLDEFCEKFHFGDSIILRPKNHKSLQFNVVYNGYSVDAGNNEIKLYLGPGIYALSELCQSYERFYCGRWYPFGVEVTE